MSVPPVLSLFLSRVRDSKELQSESCLLSMALPWGPMPQLSRWRCRRELNLPLKTSTRERTPYPMALCDRSRKDSSGSFMSTERDSMASDMSLTLSFIGFILFIQLYRSCRQSITSSSVFDTNISDISNFFKFLLFIREKRIGSSDSLFYELPDIFIWLRESLFFSISSINSFTSSRLIYNFLKAGISKYSLEDI